MGLSNFQDIKKDFPIFSRQINGRNLVYLDSAATTQKPTEVIDSITNLSLIHISEPTRLG